MAVHQTVSTSKCLLMILLSGLCTVGQAQVGGIVVGTTQAPLDGVLVELWSPTERLAAMATDATGRFHFDAALQSRRIVILARRVGYRPARVSVDSASVSLLIQMSEAPVTLDALTILAPRSPCSGDDSREARVLWSAVTRRYQAPDSTAMWAEIWEYRATVDPDRLGEIDTTRMVGPGQIAGSRNYYRLQTEGIRRQGYGARADGFLEGRFDLWRYPRLESLLAPFFVDARFGAAHKFVALSHHDDGAIVIGFCPKGKQRGVYVQGTLEITSDTTLARASWRFFTPAPSEEAGGEALFAAPSTALSSAPLLPIAGLFWRRRLLGVFQEWTDFRRWHNCAQERRAQLCNS